MMKYSEPVGGSMPLGSLLSEKKIEHCYIYLYCLISQSFLTLGGPLHTELQEKEGLVLIMN